QFFIKPIDVNETCNLDLYPSIETHNVIKGPQPHKGGDVKPMKFLSAAVCLCMALVFAAPSLHAAPSKAPFPDKLELIELLRAGKYSVLESRLNALQDRYELGDESKVVFAFSSFANSGRDLEARLNEWVNRSEASFAALGARGIYYNHMGWLARQGRFARDTNPKQFQQMRSYFAKARSDFEKALAKRPRFAVAYAELLEMVIAAGKRQQRKTILDRALAADPGSPAVISKYMWGLNPNWGGSLERMENFSRYADNERLRNQRVPKLQSYIYRFRARRYSRAKQFHEAIRVLTEGIELDESSDQHIARGDNYQSLGKQEKAIKEFNRALELWPQNYDALTERAWSFHRLKRTKLALGDLGLAIRLDPLDPDALWQRARVYLRQKNYAAALRDLDDATVFGGYNLRIVSARANLHMTYTKDYRKAAKDLERATELAPDNQRHWYNLAVAYYRIKDCKTVEATKRYIALCSQDKNCRQHSIGESIKIIHGFLKRHKQCKMKPPPLPQEPPFLLRLWERFKLGIVRTLTWMFLKPKTR
ncbi:MAG: tetratricopeptide repeat protein, partial [Alphaproteobacteria bacterium]